ncbi:hypothetical protein LSAT2_011042 [Lamellibrachia satsuma]|nr:hypothetical protein LSAT2_011042 [Lamellibrachia satsuma]
MRTPLCIQANMCAINGGATARSLDNRGYPLPRCASGGALRTVRKQRAQSRRATALFIITKSRKNISTFVGVITRCVVITPALII